MKVLTALVLSAASLTFAGGIDGKWISERQVGDADGKTYAHTTTFTLKEVDGVLTGQATQVSAAPWMKEMTGRTIEITDGKVNGAKFSFKLKIEVERGERTSIYEGTVEADQLTCTTKYRGIGITEPFHASRAK